MKEIIYLGRIETGTDKNLWELLNKFEDDFLFFKEKNFVVRVYAIKETEEKARKTKAK